MAENLEFYLEKGKALHGDLCAGIVLGTRLTLAAMKELGMDPVKKNKNLMVFVEIDRCMTDAVQAVTGCSLGHRTLKYVNYGKFGAIFYDMDAKRAIRVTERRGVRPGSGEDVAEAFRNLTDAELVNLEEVSIDVPNNDMPGKPQKIEECSRCGELIFDDRGETREGKLLCRPCANGSYYKLKTPKTSGSGRSK